MVVGYLSLCGYVVVLVLVRFDRFRHGWIRAWTLAAENGLYTFEHG